MPIAAYYKLWQRRALSALVYNFATVYYNFITLPHPLLSDLPLLFNYIRCACLKSINTEPFSADVCRMQVFARKTEADILHVLFFFPFVKMGWGFLLSVNYGV